MNRMKRQKDRTLKDELPRSVGAQYAKTTPSCEWDWIETRFNAVKSNIA